MANRELQERERDREVAEYALAAALERYHFEAGLDERRRYIALGEAMWWIVCLDEFYGGKRGLDPSGRYIAARNAHSTGRYVAGIRAARNWVGHGLYPLLTLDSTGVQLPMTLGRDPFYELRWRNPEDLPADARDQNDLLAQIYRKYLAGNPAKYALDRARQFFSLDVHAII